MFQFNDANNCYASMNMGPLEDVPMSSSCLGGRLLEWDSAKHAHRVYLATVNIANGAMPKLKQQRK